MKALAWIAAVAIATTGAAATPAAAQSTNVRVVERTHVRYEHDNRRWNRGHHYGWRNKSRWRRACHNQWRDGHRERVCRRIRYR